MSHQKMVSGSEYFRGVMRMHLCSIGIKLAWPWRLIRQPSTHVMLRDTCAAFYLVLCITVGCKKFSPLIYYLFSDFDKEFP